MNCEGRCMFCKRDIGAGHEEWCPYWLPKEKKMKSVSAVLIALFLAAPLNAQNPAPLVVDRIKALEDDVKGIKADIIAIRQALNVQTPTAKATYGCACQTGQRCTCGATCVCPPLTEPVKPTAPAVVWYTDGRGNYWADQSAPTSGSCANGSCSGRGGIFRGRFR
jgi:hypothetical protein